MLFKIDELNRTNFHKYIDNEDNFVLVVKINSGQYVAAYSEGALIPKKNSSKDGLIISLTNQKYFTLCVPNSRATVYDDFYLIFGCAEIRIRLNELKIFSNFGMINVAYNTRGETVNTLLGAGGVREVPMENYEIHKIIFREWSSLFSGIDNIS